MFNLEPDAVSWIVIILVCSRFLPNRGCNGFSSFFMTDIMRIKSK